MPHKQQKTRLSLTLLSLSMLSTGVHADDTTKAIEEALKWGKDGGVKADINYRYENVNQDNVIDPITKLPAATQPKTANANTIRTRLGLLTPTFSGLQGFVEYEGTHALQTEYNSALNQWGNNTAYSAVVDPPINELNQMWLSLALIPDTLIKGGRQRIKLDDDRFIGNVGWRQLETTYDSVLVTNKSIKDLTVNAGYIANVATFYGTNESMNAPILNVNYSMGNYGNAIFYAYWLNYTDNNPAIQAKSSQTYGVRFIGSPKINDNYSLHYTAEWGYQEDYENSPVAYDAQRINVMGGLTAYGITLQGAMEQLDGDGNGKFSTPLGTNHAFQGWADLFLITPAAGIRDVFATLSTKVWDDSLTLTGVFHDFSDDTGQTHYGDEWNFQAVKKFGKHYSLLAKYAYFNAVANPLITQTDTQKIWLQGNISF